MIFVKKENIKLNKQNNFKDKKHDFNKLKKQEDNTGFVEAQKDKEGNPIKFFNLGPENNWKKSLDTKIIKEIENSFEREMIELDYL